MDILLIAVGKTGASYVREGIAEYMKRLGRYVNFKVCELPDVRKGRISEDEQKVSEGETILRQVSDSDLLVLLDERGAERTSVEFASWLEKTMASGRKRAVFVIGGPYGFSQKVYDRADSMVSLSRMTFNHEMVRLFFIEQIYRAVSIMNHLPYHHA